MTQSRALPQTCTLNPSALTLRARLMGYLALAKSRRALAQMDMHELADIGVTPQQAQAEARRSFWDAAPHWTK